MESSYRNRKISFSTKYERARSPLLFSASLVLFFSSVSFFQLMLARAASFELLSLYELVQWVLNWSTRHFVSIIGEIHVILFKCSFIQAVFISQVFLFLVCFFLIFWAVLAEVVDFVVLHFSWLQTSLPRPTLLAELLFFITKVIITLESCLWRHNELIARWGSRLNQFRVQLQHMFVFCELVYVLPAPRSSHQQPGSCKKGKFFCLNLFYLVFTETLSCKFSSLNLY